MKEKFICSLKLICKNNLFKHFQQKTIEQNLISKIYIEVTIILFRSFLDAYKLLEYFTSSYSIYQKGVK